MTSPPARLGVVVAERDDGRLADEDDRAAGLLLDVREGLVGIVENALERPAGGAGAVLRRSGRARDLQREDGCSCRRTSEEAAASADDEGAGVGLACPDADAAADADAGAGAGAGSGASADAARARAVSGAGAESAADADGTASADADGADADASARADAPGCAPWDATGRTPGGVDEGAEEAISSTG